MHACGVFAVDHAAHGGAGVKGRVKHGLHLRRGIAGVRPAFAVEAPCCAFHPGLRRGRHDPGVALIVEADAEAQFRAVEAGRVIETRAARAGGEAAPSPVGEILLGARVPKLASK